MRDRLQPSIRASVLTPIVSALDWLPGGAEPLLKCHGLSRAKLQDPYGLIPLRHYVELFEAVAQASSDARLGLRLGQDTRPELLGPVGLVFNAAPTLREAIHSLGRFLAAWQQGTQMLLTPGEGCATLAYRIMDPATWPRRQDAEFSLAATCRMIQSRLGRRWRPLEVRFEHAPPGDTSHHEQLFGCRVTFGHPVNAIMIADTDLLRRLPSPDPIVARVFENHLNDLLDRMNGEDTTRNRVSFLIASSLGQSTVTAPGIARELGMSTRSLQRSLALDGTSLRTLIQTERLRIARVLLDAGSLSVEAIARSLGYADASVLSRAFRHWEGVPPRRRRPTRPVRR